MDFSVLSRYDDILADYFVDNLYLWYNTLRMNGDFVGANVDKIQAVDILREHVVASHISPTALKIAAEAFMSTSYFRNYTKDFGSKQLLEFSQHMKRYLIMYRHNAGFEVGSTTRYTGKPEACLIATKAWTAGEQVTCCVGSIAALSEQDDLKLKREGRDFSVMVSTRKKCSCLFLGPARFMNHDCDSNCEFILIGQNAITFRVVKDIKIGEEMTVFYADHYFGEDNCECLCVSCERMQEGHFSPSKTASTTPHESDAEQTSQNENTGSRRSERKRKEICYKDYYVPEQVKRAKPLRPVLDSKTNLKQMNEITNIVSKKEDNSSINNLQKSTLDYNVGSERLDEGFFRNQVDFKSFRPQRNTSHVGFPYQFQRATSAPPQFNFSNHANIENMQVTPIHYNAFRDTTAENDTQLEIFKDWLDNISEISDEEPSDICQSTKEVGLKCCENWKEYSLFRVSEEPDLCGRCNRHYQIYGMHWPVRRVKPTSGRSKMKLALKAEASTSVSPSPALPDKDATSPVLPMNNTLESCGSSKPRIRYKVAVRLAKLENPRIQKQKSIIPSATSYETDPIIISARPSNLSIPTIHSNNLFAHYRNAERSLVIDLQDRLSMSKPFNRNSKTPYQPICLDRDLQDRHNQLSDLQSRRDELKQLRDRLHLAIYSLRPNDVSSTTIQYIPTPEPSSPQLEDSISINVPVTTEVDISQQIDDKSEQELDWMISNNSIDIESRNDVHPCNGETLPSLDRRNDTASPASITTPIYTFTSDEHRKVNLESAEQQESAISSRTSSITVKDLSINPGSSSDVSAVFDNQERQVSTTESCADDANHSISIITHANREAHVEKINDINESDSITTDEEQKMLDTLPKESITEEKNTPLMIAKESEKVETLAELHRTFVESQRDIDMSREANELSSCSENIANVESIISVEDATSTINVDCSFKDCLSPIALADQNVVRKETEELANNFKSLGNSIKDEFISCAPENIDSFALEVTPEYLLQSLDVSLLESSPAMVVEKDNLTQANPTSEDTTSYNSEADSPPSCDKQEDTKRCNASTTTEEVQAESVSDSLSTVEADRVECEKVSKIDGHSKEEHDSATEQSNNGEPPEFERSPSITYSEVLEFAVAEEAVEAVAVEIPPTCDSTDRLRSLRPRRKRISYNDSLPNNDFLSSASDVSEMLISSPNVNLSPKATIDVESPTSPKKPHVNTSLLPELSTSFKHQMIQPRPSSLDYSTIINRALSKDLTLPNNSQVEERFSYLSAIAALKSETLGDIHSSYYTTAIPQDSNQQTSIDRSYSIPTLSSMVYQGRYDSYDSFNTSRNEQPLPPLRRETVVNDEDEYKNLLRSTTERNSALANQERLRHRFKTESTKNQDHYVEAYTEPQTSLSFQAIVNPNRSQYVYPRLEQYPSSYTESANNTPSTLPTTALNVASLLSNEQQHYGIPIPDGANFTFDHSTKHFEYLHHFNQSEVKSESTMHFNCRPNNAQSPSPVPQQLPMRVSFLLQSTVDEDIDIVGNAEVKEESSSNTISELEIPKRRATSKKKVIEPRTKINKPSTAKKPSKAKPKTSTPKKVALKTAAPKKAISRTTTPKKTSSGTVALNLDAVEVDILQVDAPKVDVDPKKKARVGCPITPPQKNPPPADIARLPSSSQKYNVINSSVLKNTPSPSSQSTRTHYSRSSKQRVSYGANY